MTTTFICRGVKMKRYQNKNNRNRKHIYVIQRQADEIRSLKRKISDLEIDAKKKDELLLSVDVMATNLQHEVDEVRSLKEQYRSLINEVNLMMQIFNKNIFKGRWKLIRLLMK